MPEYSEKYLASKAPFSADIIVRQESHMVSTLRDNGYSGSSVAVEGGILLNIKITANGLPELKKKIEGHIALVE